MLYFSIAGPFPVNYDVKNWNMLAHFLNSKQRTKIPVNTRAKLVHDAWNLAYAGDLSFATALNLTLFLKHEREHLAWDPVFTMIDHIGRHIDSSAVHKKFQVRWGNVGQCQLAKIDASGDCVNFVAHCRLFIKSLWGTSARQADKCSYYY